MMPTHGIKAVSSKLLNLTQDGSFVFSLLGELQDATKIIFQALGTSSTMQRDSLNVLGGTYSALSVLGFKIKLEPNSYDFEDQYNYILSVTEDYLAGLKVDDNTAEALADIVAKLVHKNTSLEVAQEKENGLLIHPAGKG